MPKEIRPGVDALMYNLANSDSWDDIPARLVAAMREARKEGG